VLSGTPSDRQVIATLAVGSAGRAPHASEITHDSRKMRECFRPGTLVARARPGARTNATLSPRRKHMTRKLVLGSLGLLFIAACNRSPAAEQEEARTAQQRADEKTTQYRMQADQKSAEEQAKANDQQREASRVLDQTKNDYRQKAQSDLDSITKQIDDLKAKSAKATGKARADVDQALADATARRDAVEAQIRAIDQAGPDQIETVKARLDDQIAALRQSVDEAKKRI
jgi:hypothetical protein